MLPILFTCTCIYTPISHKGNAYSVLLNPDPNGRFGPPQIPSKKEGHKTAPTLECGREHAIYGAEGVRD